MKRTDYYVDYGMDVLSINDKIDKIFDDIESMVCENCIMFKTPEYNHSFCKKINNVVPKDFGCNKFERK